MADKITNEQAVINKCDYYFGYRDFSYDDKVSKHISGQRNTVFAFDDNGNYIKQVLPTDPNWEKENFHTEQLFWRAAAKAVTKYMEESLPTECETARVKGIESLDSEGNPVFGGYLKDTDFVSFMTSKYKKVVKDGSSPSILSHIAIGGSVKKGQEQAKRRLPYRYSLKGGNSELKEFQFELQNSFGSVISYGPQKGMNLTDPTYPKSNIDSDSDKPFFLRKSVVNFLTAKSIDDLTTNTRTEGADVFIREGSLSYLLRDVSGNGSGFGSGIMGVANKVLVWQNSSSTSLNSVRYDKDGNGTELLDTIADNRFNTTSSDEFNINDYSDIVNGGLKHRGLTSGEKASGLAGERNIMDKALQYAWKRGEGVYSDVPAGETSLPSVNFTDKLFYHKMILASLLTMTSKDVVEDFASNNFALILAQVPLLLVATEKSEETISSIKNKIETGFRKIKEPLESDVIDNIVNKIIDYILETGRADVPNDEFNLSENQVKVIQVAFKEGMADEKYNRKRSRWAFYVDCFGKVNMEAFTTKKGRGKREFNSVKSVFDDLYETLPKGTSTKDRVLTVEKFNKWVDFSRDYLDGKGTPSETYSIGKQEIKEFFPTMCGLVPKQTKEIAMAVKNGNAYSILSRVWDSFYKFVFKDAQDDLGGVSEGLSEVSKILTFKNVAYKEKKVRFLVKRLDDFIRTNGDSEYHSYVNGLFSMGAMPTRNSIDAYAESTDLDYATKKNLVRGLDMLIESLNKEHLKERICGPNERYIIVIRYDGKTGTWGDVGETQFYNIKDPVQKRRLEAKVKYLKEYFGDNNVKIANK